MFVFGNQHSNSYNSKIPNIKKGNVKTFFFFFLLQVTTCLTRQSLRVYVVFAKNEY